MTGVFMKKTRRKTSDMLRFDLFLLVALSAFPCCFSEDAVVSCVLLETCVLPCRFESGPDPVIHWTKEPHDQTPVHIYFKGRNQFHIQNQNFRGRTSLFEKELSTGNASLRLSGVKVQDEGRYKCYANALSTHKTTEFYVDVLVSAPVLTVSLETRGQELLCRSEGIYPQPSVSWSPPSSAARTRVTPSEGGVWSVHSSVSLPHSPPHQHSCNVSNSRGSWRSATYRTNLDIHVSASGETEVPCTKPSAPVKSLIWRFNQTHIILSRSGPEQKNTESWTQFVVGVTESNSLVLKGLSKDQLGLFSCELKTERENFIILTQVTEAETKTETKTGGKLLHLWTMGSVLLLIVLLIALLVVVCCRRSQKRRYYMKCIRERFKPPPKTELQPVSWNKLERRNEDGDGPGEEEDGGDTKRTG